MNEARTLGRELEKWGLERQDPEAAPGWRRTHGKSPVAFQAKAQSEQTKAT